MKQPTGNNDSNYPPHGFRYFNDTICGYGSCISTSSHYHCMACGYAANELDQVSNHRNTCPAPNFSQSSNYSRSLESAMYPSSHHHTSSQQSQECSFYSSMYSSLQQTTGPPTMSPGASSFYRTQPAVFSPYYSANSLGYDGYGQGPESWPPVSRQPGLGSRDIDRLSSCKEARSTKVPLPASSSCLYSQNYSSELYSDPAGLDSCFLSRNSQMQSSSSRGAIGASSSSSQKQLPSFEPSLGFMIGPEDGMYSPAPFSFHVGSDSFTEHKASPFPEELPGEGCLGLPFPPAPPQQPPACLLEQSTEDQGSELGSDEHEIIVEETGDDQLLDEKQNIVCVVCVGPCGWAAVELHVDLPLTLSSHSPVWSKLAELLGAGLGTGRLVAGASLCCKCLQLIHTVDQLQMQLTEATQRLTSRLQPLPVKEPESELIQPEDEKIVENHSNNIQEEPPVSLEEPQTELQVEEKKTFPSLQCDPCGRSFKSRRSLTTHMRRHVRKMNSHAKCRVMCELCGRQFSSRSNLAAHKPVCSGQFPLQCNTCGKGFVLRSKLQIHEGTHRGEFPHTCDICRKGFIKLCDLVVHRRAHSGEKPFICDICGKRFSNSGNYNHHAKLHTKDRPFACSICNKGFMRRSYLSAHMNRHNGSKPFTCDVCNKAFPDRSNLHHHRRLHEGYKPYTCPVCGKALSSGLQAHLRTHSGERPFACGVCGQRFTANSSLNKHMRRHTDKSQQPGHV